MTWTLRDLVDSTILGPQTQLKDGRWVPSRPLAGPFRERLRAAWLVLRGRADAVVWPSQ